MKVVRATVVVAMLAIAAAAIAIWIWVSPDMARVDSLIASGQAPLPTRVIGAIIASEDPDFTHRNRGHTVAELQRAIVQASSRRRLDGPVRHASLSERLVGWEIHGRPISRVSRQLVVTSIVDLRYENAQIANAYANHLYLGKVESRLVFGVRAAASAYFGTSPERLSLAQLTSLVAAIRSPRVFSPLAKSELAVAQRHGVLGRLVEAGLASSAEAQAAQKEWAGGG